MGVLAGNLWLLLLLLLGVRLVTAEDVLLQAAFVQRSLTSEKEPGEYTYDIDREEVFHVDLERKDIVWRLPQFRDFTTFPAVNALSNIAILRSNLDILMRRSNNTPVENVPPKVTLYPEKPAELGEPNVLICLADAFLPPVINLTWVKNGQEVKDTEETDFYPNTDHSFRKFSYLTFVPNAEDVYYCRVEHWGLAQPLTKEWNLDMVESLPETVANVVCGLGLAVGIVGIIVGTVILIKNRQNSEANSRRRPR
ncbi:PREDICTED: HLA class II histocompatibility antigen, DR alpha chain-like [Gekko japonicus]|uniref:HLA class II histocompatibility antigen, DR alpha chain-like n=1 Tax=Gekko japonicus TaxID=146911 RepID=A0ABM1JP88_GEKJA|nr:PREDICTED: HLA class II histocompatibility antigen, DR alpha chain-like [Gekko japonicus]